MFYIRILLKFKEIKIANFPTVADAQQALRERGYRKQGESELFWTLRDPYDQKRESSYTAEILPTPTFKDEVEKMPGWPTDLSDWSLERFWRKS